MLEQSKLKLFLLFAIIVLTGVFSVNYYRTNTIKEPVPEVVEKIAKPVNLEQLRCLATNIYHEAGNEPYMGQVAVARVVMNRITHGFAKTPCAVIYQSITVPDADDPEATRKICQFSWVCAGKSIPAKNSKYHQAEDIARKVLAENKWADVIPNNVLFFHNTSVKPNWPYNHATTIGNHIFYSKGKEKKIHDENTRDTRSDKHRGS